jgi:hypothetical protein
MNDELEKQTSELLFSFIIPRSSFSTHHFFKTKAGRVSLTHAPLA